MKIMSLLKISNCRNCSSRMPKMRAISQLVSAPLKPIPIAEHFRRSQERSFTKYFDRLVSLEKFVKYNFLPSKNLSPLFLDDTVCLVKLQRRWLGGCALHGLDE